MLPILQIGPLAIPVPAVVLLLSIWIGMGQAEKYAARFRVDANLLFNLVLIAFAAGLVGARLAYAVRFPGAFAENLLSLLTPRPVMLDLPGGLLAAGIAALIYGQRKQMPFWTVLDALTPALAVFAIGSGISQLASGDGFGAPTRLPWGIEMWGEVRHPTQLYTIAAAGMIAILVWPRKSANDEAYRWPPGNAFLSFVVLSAAARLIIETFRGDSQLLAGNLRLAQVGAWVVLAVGLWLLGKRQPGSNRDEANPSLETT